MPDPTFNALTAKLAMPANKRYAHPSVEVLERLVPQGKALPQPAGNQLYWRINEAILLDNFDGFFDRKNEIMLVATTVDSNAADPIQFSTKSFVGIKKNDRLPIGDGGLGMYYSSPGAFPKYLGISLLVVEDDKDIRDLGATIRQVRETPEYQSILSTAQGLATSANPLYGTLVGVGDALTGLIAKLMEQNKDDVVAYFASTYTLAFDDLGRGKHTFHQEGRARIQYEILAQQ